MHSSTDRACRDNDRLGSSSNHGSPPGIQVFVYAHDLLDSIEIHAHGLGVHDRGVLLREHAAVAPRHANEWHQVAQDVVEDDFLVALVVQKVGLYLCMAERHLELSLEACFDLRTQPIDVHFVAVIRHEAENFLELVVFTSSELAQRAMCVLLWV